MKQIHLLGERSSFRLSAENDGDGDYLVAIEVEAEGFRGHADGHIVGDAWKSFVTALAALDVRRKGEATIESAMPGEFSIRIGALNRRGHMSVTGKLSYRLMEWPQQHLEFAFEFDPSQLEAVQRGVQP